MSSGRELKVEQEKGEQEKENSVVGCLDFPTICGHELAGVVEAVNDPAATLRPAARGRTSSSPPAAT